ncbi:MAG TPA: hypothetical protein VL137_07465 [Polyangiaceae bacterium]|nr:hypothetical protein [Polyangiaceae bacterium]
MKGESSRRGRYDRHSSRDDRSIAERAALNTALQALLAEGRSTDLSVAAVCERAAVGRNTLYAHYDGVPGLLQEVRGECERGLAQVLRQAADNARTPRARLSQLCSAWVEFLVQSPQVPVLAVTANGDSDAVDTVLGQELAVFARQAYAAGFLSRPPSEDSLAVLCGAFRAVAQRQIRGKIELNSAEMAGLLERITLTALR